MVEIIVTELNKKKNFFFFNEDRLRDLWDKVKWISIHIIGVPEGEETEKDPKKIFEGKIDENFPHVKKKIVNQVQEV